MFVREASSDSLGIGLEIWHDMTGTAPCHTQYGARRWQDHRKRRSIDVQVQTLSSPVQQSHQSHRPTCSICGGCACTRTQACELRVQVHGCATVTPLCPSPPVARGASPCSTWPGNAKPARECMGQRAGTHVAFHHKDHRTQEQEGGGQACRGQREQMLDRASSVKRQALSANSQANGAVTPTDRGLAHGNLAPVGHGWAEGTIHLI